MVSRYVTDFHEYFDSIYISILTKKVFMIFIAKADSAFIGPSEISWCMPLQLPWNVVTDDCI